MSLVRQNFNIIRNPFSWLSLKANTKLHYSFNEQQFEKNALGFDLHEFDFQNGSVRLIISYYFA